MAGEVVRACDGLDPEPPVLAGARLAVLEDHHAADRLAALEVADVVALDPERSGRQAQRFGQLLQRNERLALVRQPARLFAGERLGRIAGRERHQLPLFAALRDAEMNRAVATRGEERLDVGRVGQATRDEDL